MLSVLAPSSVSGITFSRLTPRQVSRVLHRVIGVNSFMNFSLYSQANQTMNEEVRRQGSV